MITQCDNKHQQEVLDYIGDNYSKCLYLYLDIIKYGCSSEVTRTWIQRFDGSITAVILGYHTAMHIFSKNNDLGVLEICELIEEIKPTMVNATANSIKKLVPALEMVGFVPEFGHIGEWMENADSVNGNEIVEADENDIPKVARLLLENDDIGASYTFEDLLKQMQERLEHGYVRSYVIHHDNEVVAHVGTGAETNQVCTIAYSITSPKFRGRGLASKLYSYACSKLKSEGKRVFSVYYSDNAHAFHHKMGFVDLHEYGKLYKIVI